MAKPDRAELIEQAADVFARLQADPENRFILNERDAFLHRGDAQTTAYATGTNAWSGAGQKPLSYAPKVLLGLALLAGLGFFAADPLRLAFVADVVSGVSPETVSLASGDIALVDADTALVDHSDQVIREVELLEGAAVFDVDVTGQAFRVIAGAVTVEVLGTTFETALNGNVTTVSVEEGTVQVTYLYETWKLSRGHRLRISAGGDVALQDIPLENVAGWRKGSINIDSLSFEEVSDMLDRRLPGSVYVPNGSLRRTIMSGTIDLNDPETALKTLAVSSDARLVPVSPWSWVILRN